MTEDSAQQDVETIARLLRRALSVRDASLVVHRRGVLVEFKTDLLLETLSVWEEEGYRSWQVGAFDDHHCHLALDAIVEVHLDAEPVSCQRGRINFTVWFLCKDDCGNPYRPRGLFSVTLNRPYEPDGSPRREILAQLADLYEDERHCPVLTVSPAFEDALATLMQTPVIPAPVS